MDNLPDYYKDPYLRRYWIVKYATEAVLCSLGVWGMKLIA
jgi:hypothetical protein